MILFLFTWEKQKVMLSRMKIMNILKCWKFNGGFLWRKDQIWMNDISMKIVGMGSGNVFNRSKTMAWHFNYYFSLLLFAKIQQTTIKLIFLLLILVELKLILMLLMPQPICERCWWHWLNYICNFSIVWFNKNIIFLKFMHVCDSWKIIINNLFCSTCSLISSGHQASTFLHGM
jgi:hypothetical protein